MTEFKKIIVNGQEIDPQNIQAIPEALRQVMADKNNNGIPDFLEGILDNPMVKKVMEHAGAQNFDQLPPELRAKLEPILQKFGKSTSGTATQVQMTTMSMGGQAPSLSSMGAQSDWKQSITPEEPSGISVKTFVFVSLAVAAFMIVVFIAVMGFVRH